MTPFKKPQRTKFPILGCLCIYLAFSFFRYSAVFNWDLQIFDPDSSLIEGLTAACLFLASLLLLALAKMEKVRIRQWAYLLGGLTLAFNSGEELSWGQHIFDFATPNFIAEWNSKKEFILHNIPAPQVHLNYMLAMVPLLASIVVCAAIFSRQDKFIGIPLPSVPLMLSFLLIIYPEYLLPEEGLWSILPGPVVLLLTAFLFMLFSGRVRHSIFTVTLLTMPAASFYAGYRCDCNVWYTYNEAHECLLALAGLFYAAELWREERGKGEAKASRRLLRGLAALWKARTRSLPPPWLTASALMFSASIGLAASAHFFSRTTAVPITEGLSKILAVKPIIRSKWEVRIMEDSLVYFKEPCKRTDTWTIFFVHIYYTDPDDLPGARKVHGFDNLDFDFVRENGMKFDGKCLVKRRMPLPNISAVRRIRTGQWVPQDNRHIWEVEFFPSQQTEAPLL